MPFRAIFSTSTQHHVRAVLNSRLWGRQADLSCLQPQRPVNPSHSAYRAHLSPSVKTLSRGLGVVFNSVQLEDTTSMTLYDQNDNVIFEQFVETGEQSSLSFLGAVFDDPTIAYAQITAGTDPVSLANGVSLSPIDFVVMDDFIFGEPISVDVAAVPIPGSIALLPFGLAALGAMRRRKES